MKLLFCLILVSAFMAMGQNAVFLPFLWASPTVCDISPGTTNYYHVPICGISQYKYLNVNIDMPYMPWSPADEIMLFMAVYNNSNFSGTPLFDNKNSTTGELMQNIQLKYQEAYGDLFISLSAGPLPADVTYNLVISSPPTNDTELQAEARGKPEVMNLLGNSNITIIHLLQLLYYPTPLSLPTNLLTPLLIDFTFCPISDKYQLDVIIAAADDKSAFSTYICTNFSISQPCSAGSGKIHNDPKAAALNHVTLVTSTREFTALEVAIYGLGNYGANNSFMFSVGVISY